VRAQHSVRYSRLRILQSEVLIYQVIPAFWSHIRGLNLIGILPAVWLPGNLAANLPTAIREFWTGQKLGWSVLARVADYAKWTTYILFGFGASDSRVVAATVVSGEYTSTRSIFDLTAGTVTFKLEFFSPVGPKNYVRQRLPFSYLTVTASSSTGVLVQVYSAIDKSFTRNFDSAPQIILTQTTFGKTSIYEWTPSTPQVFQEKDQFVQWGTVVFASRESDGSKGLTHTAGPRDSVRGHFVSNGTLRNPNTNVRADTITAYSHDLGMVTSASSVTFAIGHFHEDAINYLGAHRTPYFRCAYSNSTSALLHFWTTMPLHIQIYLRSRASCMISKSPPVGRSTEPYLLSPFTRSSAQLRLRSQAAQTQPTRSISSSS
jgi:hypothetical protein